MTSERSTTEVLALLRASHDRLTAALAALDDEAVAGPSYDDDWSIGQVASHLGSGAEIFGLFLEAGRTGAEPPGQEAMQPVWDRWDAKSAPEQARDAVVTDAAFLDRVANLPADDQEAWRLEVFGRDQALPDLLQMRLSEHALHTWDIAVMSDPALGVDADAAAVVMDQLAMMAGYAGRAADEPLAVAVHTTGPDGDHLLRLGPERIALEAGAADSGDSDGELTLPTEAFVRLVYGRLDPDHTPDSVTASGVDLDRLREAFPGV